MKIKRILLSLLICTALTAASVSLAEAAPEAYGASGSASKTEELTGLAAGTVESDGTADMDESDADSDMNDGPDEIAGEISDHGADAAPGESDTDLSGLDEDDGLDEIVEDLSESEGPDLSDAQEGSAGDGSDAGEISGLDSSAESGDAGSTESLPETVPSDESLTSAAGEEVAPAETVVGETIRRDIEEGLYVLVPKLSTSVCVGINNNSKGNGANVQLVKNNGGFSQAFYVKRVNGTSRYRLVNYHSGKALEVKGDSHASGTNVIQNGLSGALSQQWIFADSAPGYLQIRACGKKTVLALSGGKAAAGTNVQADAAGSSDGQKWKLVPAKGKVAAEALLKDAKFKKGYYRIETSGSESLSIDVVHNSKAANANIRVFRWLNSGAQIFRIVPLGDGTYTINGYNSGKYFDCADAKHGSNIYQAAAWSGETQRWYILEDSSTGEYVIRNKLASHVVVTAEGMTAGANVGQRAFAATEDQYWKISKIAGSSIHVEPKDGVYEFRSGLDSNMCLDVAGASSSNNANIQLYQANGSDAQRFAITCEGYGVYKVVNMNSLKALHLTGNKNVDGTNVVQYKNFNTGAQKWKISWNGRIGGYQVTSYGKSLVLDVKDGNTGNGTNVRVKTAGNSTAQKWVLNKVDSYNGSWHMKVMCSGTACTFKVYQVVNGVLREKLSTSGFIGRNGSGKTVEGDGKTPLGTFTVGKAYGIADDPGSIIPYTKVTNSMYWCGRSDSPYYNTLIDASKSGPGDEHLIEYTEAYQYLLDIGYNTACTPRLGSAIFLHCSRNQPTAGCIAIPKDDMAATLRMITAGTKISIE